MILTKGKKYIYKGLELEYIGVKGHSYCFCEGSKVHFLYNLSDIEEQESDIYSAIKEIKAVLFRYSDEEIQEIVNTMNVIASEIRDKKPIYYASYNMQ